MASPRAFLDSAGEGTVPVDKLDTLLSSLNLSEVEIAEVMTSVQQVQHYDEGSGQKVIAVKELKDIVEHAASAGRRQSQVTPPGTVELMHTASEITAEEPCCASALCLLVQKLRLCCENRSSDEIYSGKMRPTNRLIIFVVVMSVVMSLSVAGTAVGLSWTHSLSDHQEALRSEIELAAQAVGSFVGGDRAVKSQGDMASMIGDVVHEVGYNASVETAIGVMLNSVRVMGIIADNLFEITNTHEVAVVAQVLAAVVGRLCTLGHCG
eukprot:RCo019945